MKITIDTEQKTIKLEGQVKLSELIKEMKKRNIDFDKYSLVGYEDVWQWFSIMPDYKPWEIISETITSNVSTT